jgi:hypothetical protein
MLYGTYLKSEFGELRFQEIGVLRQRIQRRTIYIQNILDFQKNNFTLSEPSVEIPYLKWAWVRLNRVKILAFIYLKSKRFGTTKEFIFRQCL